MRLVWRIFLPILSAWIMAMGIILGALATYNTIPALLGAVLIPVGFVGTVLILYFFSVE